VAVLLAGADGLWVRLSLEHRSADPWMHVHALLLWCCLVLLAVVPASLWAVLRGRDETALEAGLGLLGWSLVPVLLHAILDPYTAVGKDISSLLTPRPWLECSACILVVWVALILFGRRGAARGGRFWGWTALAVGLFLAIVPTGGGSLPSGPSTPVAKGPNVLLLVLDTMRADRMGHAGNERGLTPALDRLASESIAFEDARSASTFTLSSHLSMLTGVHPSVHGSTLNSMRYLPSKAESAFEIMRRAGYRTAAFVGSDVLSARTGFAHGFEVFDDHVDPDLCATHAWRMVHDVQAVLAERVSALHQNGRPHWFQDFERSAKEVFDRTLAWIGEDDPRPWACLVNVYDSHWPYLPGEAARARFVRDYSGPMDGFLFRSDSYRPGYVTDSADRQHLGDLYDGEVSELDAQIEAFLGALGLERGGTAVLVTADHGEALGEVDPGSNEGFWKHEDVGESQVRVPFLLRPAEARPVGRSVGGPVSGIDVAPTLLGLAGIEYPAEWPGIDLMQVEPAADRAVLIEDRDNPDPLLVRFALYRGRWKAQRRESRSGVELRLHDLRADPEGLVDVGAEHPDVLARMAAELERISNSMAPRTTGEGVGARNLDALRGLGYAGDGR